MKTPTRAGASELFLVLLAVLVGLGGSSCAKHQPPQAESPTSTFDYYLLALSWAPQFCATAWGDSSECDPKHHFGFIVHGLWPQNEDGSYPMNCAQVRPPGQDTVRQMMTIMPNRGLIQHEWREHGSCSGADAESYFAAIEKAFTQLNIPADYRQAADSARRDPRDVEQSFAQANRAPASAFRVVCSSGKLSGIDVCLTKDLRYRTCGRGVRECRARLIAVRPVP
jgi:ribonuclease T2